MRTQPSSTALKVSPDDAQCPCIEAAMQKALVAGLSGHKAKNLPTAALPDLTTAIRRKQWLGVRIKKQPDGKLIQLPEQ